MLWSRRTTGARRLPVLDGTHRLVADVAEAEAASRRGAAAQRRVPRQRGVAGARQCSASRSAWRSAPAARVAGVTSACSTRSARRACPSMSWPAPRWAPSSAACGLGGASAGGSRRGREEWRSRRRRLREWRLWRMHMASERQLDELLRRLLRRRARQRRPPRRSGPTRPTSSAATRCVLRARPAAARRARVDGVPRLDAAGPPRGAAARRRRRRQSRAGAGGPRDGRGVRRHGARRRSVGAEPLARRYPHARLRPLRPRVSALRRRDGTRASDAASDVVVVPDLGDATMLSFERDRELIAAGGGRPMRRCRRSSQA